MKPCLMLDMYRQKKARTGRAKMYLRTSRRSNDYENADTTQKVVYIKGSESARYYAHVRSLVRF